MANTDFRDFAKELLGQAAGERMDNMAYEAMSGTTVSDPSLAEKLLNPGPFEPEPSIKEQDFDGLRDFLVDMCSATLPDHPPSQEDWDEIRKRTKAAAVEHAMHNRDEKKSVKKPGGLESTGRKILSTPPRHGKSELVSKLFPQWATMIKSMPSDTPFQGKTSDLFITDEYTELNNV